MSPKEQFNKKIDGRFIALTTGNAADTEDNRGKDLESTNEKNRDLEKTNEKNQESDDICRGNNPSRIEFAKASDDVIGAKRDLPILIYIYKHN